MFQKEKTGRKLLRKEGIPPEITDTLRSTWRAGASRGPGTTGEPAGHTPWSPQASVVDGTSNTSSGHLIFSQAGLSHRCLRCRAEKAAGHAPSSSSYSAMAPARRQHQGGGRGRMRGQLARNSPFAPFIQAMITCPPLTLKTARRRITRTSGPPTVSGGRAHPTTWRGTLPSSQPGCASAERTLFRVCFSW